MVIVYACWLLVSTVAIAPFVSILDSLIIIGIPEQAASPLLSRF